MRFTALLGLCLGCLIGCATYHDDLERGQHYYEVSQYPNALAIWRTLELDIDSLSYAEQARYAYLRGMTDYQMGYRGDARHWLAVAAAIDQKHPGGLDANSKAALEKSLAELNAAVYAKGPPPSAAATGVELENVTPAEPSPQPLVNQPILPAEAAAQPAPAQPSPATAAPSAAPTAPPPAAAPPANVPPPSGM